MRGNSWQGILAGVGRGRRAEGNLLLDLTAIRKSQDQRGVVGWWLGQPGKYVHRVAAVDSLNGLGDLAERLCRPFHPCPESMRLVHTEVMVSMA